MAAQPTEEPAQTATNDRKLVVTVPEELLTTLRTTCAEKAKVSLLGRIQGKHPGLKALTAWARDTLHPSLNLLTLKANNLFEISFSEPEGRIHALTQTELVCDSANISFSSWRPHFDAKTHQAKDQLDFPIWLQIVDLCQILRDDTFLRTIGAHIGQVIAIDSSEAYRAKLFGPRVRILVSEIDKLPHTVVLPRLDGDGVVEYNLEYSGLPNQCGRCRALDHQVRHCPKRDFKPRREHQGRGQQAAPPRQAEPLRETEQGIPVGNEPHRTKASTGENTPQTEVATEAVDKETLQTVALPEAFSEPSQKETSTDLPATTETIAAEAERPSTPTKQQTAQEESVNIPPELQPNEINFPALSSPGTAAAATTPQPATTPPPGTPHTFIWRKKPQQEGQQSDKGKGKPNPDSVPLTRQGYRSGRLAEDLWEVLNIPGTPSTAKKKLRVIPFLSKNQAEYLVDKSKPPFTSITTVHIAELLAGVPWTVSRAKQHIVNEMSQALHKVLIFNNQHTTPIHKWEQGRWFSNWTCTGDGEYTCTLYVLIGVVENKTKIRKGKELGWRKIPVEIQEALAGTHTELIQDVEKDDAHWAGMAGQPIAHNPFHNTPTPTAAATNPFAALLEVEGQPS